jgi:hypothetical protein
MRDPTRWRDDPTGLTAGAGVLLRGTRRPQPPGSHDLERLGVAVDGISRRPVGAPVSWLRLAVAGAVAFAIAGGGTFVWALHARNARRLAAEAAQVEKIRRVAAQVGGPLEHRVAIAEPARVPPAMAAPARPARRHLAEARVASPAPVEAVAPTDSLSREIPLIDAGRSDLAAAPSRALAALETHRREFPRGQLAAEREFLAVQALLQMNRVADAKKRAGELATRFPTSSYAARASRLIEDVEAQKAAVPALDGSRGSHHPGLQRDRDRL